MCGVRCTPNLAAYCNNGLHLTSRVRGVIFKLLHKLYFFPSFAFGKITSQLLRDNLQAPDVLLACSTYYLLQLTYRHYIQHSSASTAYYPTILTPSVFVSISNFACAIPLNCDAKVQTYLETTKQKTKNLCLFNVLQQISMFLPKFIHILSTKLAKCAIYKAKIFVFRHISTHERARTLYKD